MQTTTDTNASHVDSVLTGVRATTNGCGRIYIEVWEPAQDDWVIAYDKTFGVDDAEYSEVWTRNAMLEAVENFVLNGMV